jgi:hypothetical protein
MNDDEIKEVLVTVYNRYGCGNGDAHRSQSAAREAALELIDGLTVNNIQSLVTTLCKFCMFGAPCSTTKDSQK